MKIATKMYFKSIAVKNIFLKWTFKLNVVFLPGLPGRHKQLKYFSELSCDLLSYSLFLSELCMSFKNLYLFIAVFILNLLNGRNTNSEPPITIDISFEMLHVMCHLFFQNISVPSLRFFKNKKPASTYYFVQMESS